MSSESGSPTPTAVTRVEFRLQEPEFPFVQVTAEQSCTARLEEVIPRDEGYTEFFTFTGVDPAAVFEAVEEVDPVDARLLTANDHRGLFEFDVAMDRCPAVFLAEQGALPRKIHADDGSAHLVADIPVPEEPGSVIEAFLDRYDSATLATKREQSEAAPMFEQWELRRMVRDRLTDRQQQVLLAAYEAGYYDWPRETDAQTLAEQLDIASATLHKHLRAAERKLVTALFDGGG